MNVRYLLFAVLTLGLFVRAGCGDVTDKIKVNVPISLDYHFTVPVITSTDTIIGKREVQTADIENMLQENNSSLNKDNIESVYIESINLKIDEDSQYEQDNLTSFTSMDAFFSSNDFPTKIKVAHVETPKDSFQVSFPVDQSISLKSYFLQADQFNLELNIVPERKTTHELNTTVTVKFMIVTKL